MNNIKKAIHQAVEEENRLSETLWTFIIAAKDALDQEEDHLKVKKDFRKFTSQANFISMYNKLYTFFKQKEKDFSQQMQQIKNNIHQVIYDTMCYDSSYASMLIAMLMTMLMTMFMTIVDCSSLDYWIVSKSTLFRVSLCSSESYK